LSGFRCQIDVAVSLLFDNHGLIMLKGFVS
jgi:hypothetical protein